MRTLLACVLLGTSMTGVALAASPPRAPPPQWKDPAGEPVAMDVWLDRLVGRFQFEGVVEVPDRCVPPPPPPDGSPPPFFSPLCSTVTGVGDCVSIGTGPGVHCIFNARWDDLYEIVHASQAGAGGIFAVPGGVNNLAPSVALFGMDASATRLSMLLVDNKGLAEAADGSLHGARATLETRCVNDLKLYEAMRRMPPPPRTCRRITRIEAREDGRFVRMSVDFRDQRRSLHALCAVIAPRGAGCRTATGARPFPSLQVVASRRRSPLDSVKSGAVRTRETA